MHILRKDIDNFHSMLLHNNELICVVPTSYVSNILHGIERMYDLGKKECEEEIYNTGYKDGIKDIVTEIHEVCSKRV
jgi:hypothetical protein